MEIALDEGYYDFAAAAIAAPIEHDDVCYTFAVEAYVALQFVVAIAADLAAAEAVDDAVFVGE